MISRRDFFVKALAFGMSFEARANELVEQADESELAKLRVILKRLEGLPTDTRDGIRARVLAASEILLNSRFSINPIGEGVGAFDSDPLFTMQEFDCLTFCEVIIAIARSNSAAEVFENVIAMRYKSECMSFGNRNHFPSLEWIPSAINRGFVSLADRVNRESVTVSIGRRAWMANLRANPMYQGMYSQLKFDRERTCSAEDAELVSGDVHYLAVRRFNAGKKITSGALLAVVRPSGFLNRKAGGGEVISHFGFGIRAANKSWAFRAASEKLGRVADVPLNDVLFHRSSHPPLGIVVMNVEPTKNSTEAHGRPA